MEDSVEDLITVDSDDSFFEIEHKENDIERIFSQWKENDNMPATKSETPSKYVDTRTFTRPKKRIVQNLENSFLNTRNNQSTSSPINLQIGGQISTPFNMQRSWLNDVSPPISLCTSVDLSTNERMNSSLIHSGDFTNVSSFLTSHHIGDSSVLSDYCFDDLIKDRQFLENLTNNGDDSLSKDESISKTDLSSLVENPSFNKTLENSLENHTFTPDKLNVTTINVNTDNNSTFTTGNKTFQKADSHCLSADQTFDCPKTGDSEEDHQVTPPKPPARRLSGVRNKTFDNVEMQEHLSGLANQTFEAGMNQTFKKSASQSNNRPSNVNQTFNCEDGAENVVVDEVPNKTFNSATTNKTFESGLRPTFNNINDQTLDNIANTTFGNMIVNATFDSASNKTYDRSADSSNKTYERNKTKFLSNGGDANLGNSLIDDDFVSPSVMGDQSTPLQTPTVRSVTSNNLNSTLETQFSPITSKDTFRKSRRSDIGILRSTKKFQDIQEMLSPDGQQFDLPPLLMRQHQLQQHFSQDDIENESIPGQMEHNIRQSIDEKRISLLTFEDVEKSILLLNDQQNEVDFDEILNTLTERKPTENDKFRQSLDNIKKRHSLINFEKQQDDLKRKETMLDATLALQTSGLDNKLMDSINSSSTSSISAAMNSSTGSDRLLNRRSRLYDGLQNTMTLPPTSNDETEEDGGETEQNSTEPGGQTEQRGGSIYDRKNRDRFKTIKINKKLGEGMVVIASETDANNELESQEDSTISNNAFNKINVNSPKNSKNLPTDRDTLERNELFKKPAPIDARNTQRSLSKPRFYSALPQSKKDLTLPLAMKSCSSDNLDNKYSENRSSDRNLVKSNMKSPMGVKSISYHNLVFNNNSSSNSNNNSKSKLSAASSGPMKQFGMNNFTRGTSVQPVGAASVKEKQNALNMKQRTAASRMVNNVRQHPISTPKSTMHNNSNSIKSSSQTQLSSGASQLKAPAARGRPGLIRPSSGYFTYNSKRNDSDTESGRYSPNSLSSSSASSRGSLLQSDVPATTAHPAQDLQKLQSNKCSTDDLTSRTKPTNFVEPKSVLPRPSGLKPPSNLRLPTARSGLPRPSFVKR